MYVMKRLLSLFLFLTVMGFAYGQAPGARGGTDSVRVYFRQGDARLDPLFRENAVRIRAFTERFLTLVQDTTRHILGLRITAGASPEGGDMLNMRLSERRAEAIRRLVRNYMLRDVAWSYTVPKGADWEGLERLVRADVYMPYRDAVLFELQFTPEWVTRKGRIVDGRKKHLMDMEGGRVWRYLENRYFPDLRASTLQIWYEKDEQKVVEKRTEVVKKDTVYIMPKGKPEIKIEVKEKEQIKEMPTVVPEVEEVKSTAKPFYMGLKANLLYYAVAVPNIGVEFYLGRGWSVAGNWMYAWWKSDKSHRYHRIYGGDLEVRRWLSYGKKPLTGHHIGLYGQLLTYDFEWGGKGYMGGKPGSSLWEKPHYGGGIAYGYSAPIGYRLNLDMTLGVGYLGGTYYEYIPKDNFYIWQATKNRHWFGPTKAEITLVWLLGHDNTNSKKGGKQ